MDELGKSIAVSILFLSMATVFILRGPLGRALADRLGGRPRVDDREVEQLRAELADVRQQLAEVHERLDFTERLLARPKEGGIVADRGT